MYLYLGFGGSATDGGFCDLIMVMQSQVRPHSGTFLVWFIIQSLTRKEVFGFCLFFFGNLAIQSSKFSLPGEDIFKGPSQHLPRILKAELSWKNGGLPGEAWVTFGSVWHELFLGT